MVGGEEGRVCEGGEEMYVGRVMILMDAGMRFGMSRWAARGCGVEKFWETAVGNTTRSTRPREMHLLLCVQYTRWIWRWRWATRVVSERGHGRVCPGRSDHHHQHRCRRRWGRGEGNRGMGGGGG